MKMTIKARRRWAFIIAAIVAIVPRVAPAQVTRYEPEPRKAVQHVQQGSNGVEISTVSARNDMVTGGDVLVRIDGGQTTLRGLGISLNGKDASAAFRATDEGRALTGLVAGLKVGDNVIEVTGPPDL